MTTFLYDAWYCASFAEDVKPGQLKPVTIMEQPIALFRRPDGSVAALADRCPHRFAPLSMGKVCSDGQVQCQYHGLQFDNTGQCTHNPHGDGAIPKLAQVRAYPIQEVHGALWIWMGDASRADPALLPNFGEIDQRPGWSRVQGYVHVRANYQLMNDNLLDLSHVPFLHPFLASADPLPPEFRADIRMEQREDAVISISEFQAMPTSPLYKMLWERGEAPKFCDMRANMRWTPPSTLLLDTGASPMGGARSQGPSAPSAHWLTPETETTTHYFWAAARDRYVGDAEVSARVQAGIDTAFRTEDEPMIEACQRSMRTTDLMSLKPVLLQTDGPAVRARRILDSLLERQGH